MILRELRWTRRSGNSAKAGRAASNASWGLHLIDVNLAMGNLVDIVREQSKAFVTAGKKSHWPWQYH